MFTVIVNFFSPSFRLVCCFGVKFLLFLQARESLQRLQQNQKTKEKINHDNCGRCRGACIDKLTNLHLFDISESVLPILQNRYFYYTKRTLCTPTPTSFTILL